MPEPCKTIVEIIALRGINSYTADLLCDPWANTHILGPMFLYILTQNWPIVFLLTGLNEVLEAVLVQLSGGFAIFPEVEGQNDFESITQALVDDWLTQGSIGLILGGLFVYALRSPVLWKGWRTDRTRWWYYFFVFGIFIILTIPTSLTIEKPEGLEGVSSSTTNKTDFWVGPPIVTILEGGVIMLAQYGEPWYSNAWLKEPPWKRRAFWNGFWVIHACYHIQAPWDWFYSGHAQSWLLSGILAVALLVIIGLNGDLNYAIERFDSWADKWKPRPAQPPPIIDDS